MTVNRNHWLHHPVFLVLVLVLSLGGARGAAASVSAEAWLGNTTPFVKESTLYTVRVLSSDPVRSVELVPPVIDGGALESLDEGPVSGEVYSGGRRYITNDFRYVFTPMRPGPVEIGPARLKVKGSGGWQGFPGAGGEQEVETQALRVEVSPALAGGGEWRPLQWLDVVAYWSGLERAEAGEPLTLTLEMKARGTRGNQLPSLATQLAVPGFKVYPERPRVDTRVVSGGYVWGRRIETYTLVPTVAGAIEFPELSVPWWDVNTRTAMTARVPGRLVLVGDEARESGSGGVVGHGAGMGQRFLSQGVFYNYLLPLGGGLVVAFIVGWWIGSGGRMGSGAGAAWRWALGRLGGLARAGGRVVGGWLPESLRARLAARVQGAMGTTGRVVVGSLVRVMPLRTKVWWCVRCVDRAADPRGLCTVLRRFACDHMAMSPNAPLEAIAACIADERPRADVSELRRLFRSVDDAVYGGHPIGMAEWKRAFRRRFRRALRGPTRDKLQGRTLGLPDLNP